MITNVIFQSILIVDTDKHKARHVSFLPGSNAYTYRRTRGNAPFPSASIREFDRKDKCGGSCEALGILYG